MINCIFFALFALLTTTMVSRKDTLEVVINKSKKTMTSRERVITALEHKEPDRVSMSMSITVDAYNNLEQYLGIELEEDLEIGYWTEVPIHPLMAEKFGLDVFWLQLGSARKKVQ